jgi:hypothetical protein
MGGGSGGGSSGAGWTLMLLPAVDGEILAEYWTDTNATPVEVTAGQSTKISASKIYLSIMCDGEPVSALDIPVLFDGNTAKYDTQNECYTLSASSGTHTVQVGTVTLTISPGKVGLMRPGDRATFTATVSPANLSVIWSVDGPGNLTGNGLAATYTATQAGAVQVAAAVDMTNAGSSVSFTVSEPIVKIRRHRMRDDGTYEIEHHETGAEQVIFSDGETFQAKLDAGKLNGADGKSAYQQAVDAGYTGTEAAFYAALVALKDGPFLPTKGGAVKYLGIIEDLSLSGPTADDGFYILGSKGIVNEYQSATFAGLAGDEPVRLSGIYTPTAPTDAANKDYVDKKTLVFTGKTVATTAWAANSTYSAQGYGFRASVACAGVTTSHRPDVAFGAADSVGGNFAPFCESYAGGVYIYAKTKPTATITIPSIVCVKGV